MTGDSADNIKGAEKVGPKIAALLLRDSITRNMERLKINQKLVYLHREMTTSHVLSGI